MAYRSKNRSRNTYLHHRIYRQILSSSVISSLQSFISCPYLILDKSLKMKPMAIILEEKATSSISKDFLAWDMMVIQINNISHNFNKRDYDARHDQARI